MLAPRIIPCLLVKNRGLVKSMKFGDYRYVGDPINAVKIFNEKEVDELVILDIDASAQQREPDYDMIAIHRHDQLYTAAQLVKRVTGRPLSVEPFTRHITRKVNELYS